MLPNELTTLPGVFLVRRSLPDVIWQQAGKATFLCLLMVGNEWKNKNPLQKNSHSSNSFWTPQRFMHS